MPLILVLVETGHTGNPVPAPWIHLKKRVRTLCLVRRCTGSQWRVLRAVVPLWLIFLYSSYDSCSSVLKSLESPYALILVVPPRKRTHYQDERCQEPMLWLWRPPWLDFSFSVSVSAGLTLLFCIAGKSLSEVRTGLLPDVVYICCVVSGRCLC